MGVYDSVWIFGVGVVVVVIECYFVLGCVLIELV